MAVLLKEEIKIMKNESWSMYDHKGVVESENNPLQSAET